MDQKNRRRKSAGKQWTCAALLLGMLLLLACGTGVPQAAEAPTPEPAAADTRELARIFLAAGADCIVGSHPHRVKDAEFVTVAREDGPYTGLVLYSLGNFTASNKFTRMVGLYAQLTLKKDFGTGQVTLSDAAVLPTLTIRRKLKAGPRFAVMPAYTDPERIIGLAEPLTKEEIGLLEKARAYALQQLGDVDGLRVLSDPEA